MTSFILWAILFAGIWLGLFISAKKSRHIDAQSEEVASSALPAIGGIAERQHLRRYGRPVSTTDTPGPPGRTTWYPPTKHRKRDAST